MAAFEHVVLLLSFVYALALTHLLSRIGALLIARARVRFSGLLALAMANAIVLVYSDWLSLWDLRGIKSWDIASVTLQFVFAIMAYFMCSLAAPEGGEGEIDMEDFYWRQRQPFYWIILVLLVMSLAINAEYLETPDPSLFLKENMAVLPMFVPVGIALLFPARWAQWFGGIALFLMTTGFTIVFSSTLH